MAATNTEAQPAKQTEMMTWGVASGKNVSSSQSVVQENMHEQSTHELLVRMQKANSS